VVTLLGLVLREAMDEHYLLFDPTARLRLRDGPAEPRPVAGPDEVRLIADRMSDSHTRALVITAAYPGMRFGELAALARANTHLGQAVIHVSLFRDRMCQLRQYADVRHHDPLVSSCLGQPLAQASRLPRRLPPPCQRRTPSIIHNRGNPATAPPG
jgi:integrase